MLSDYILEVATPFSTGPGIYLPDYQLVVTNEHTIRDNASVVVGAPGQPRQLARIVYLDPFYDLAFLQLSAPVDRPPLPLYSETPVVGMPVVAYEPRPGKQAQTCAGQLHDTAHLHNGIPYLRHDAPLESAHSGSPLFTPAGALLGINMLASREVSGQILSLPANLLRACLHDYLAGNGQPGSRCFDCRELVFEPPSGRPPAYCPGCGSAVTLPGGVDDYVPTGVAATAEAIIAATGHDPRLARRGPNLWAIRQGSAVIQLAYHEESGLLTGDAYLCQLPEIPRADLYAFLLRENYQLEQLAFSTFGRDIILSLLIYDRYLTVETALSRFEHLFRKADTYDNILVERYGATWK